LQSRDGSALLKKERPFGALFSVQWQRALSLGLFFFQMIQIIHKFINNSRNGKTIICEKYVKAVSNSSKNRDDHLISIKFVIKYFRREKEGELEGC